MRTSFLLSSLSSVRGGYKKVMEGTLSFLLSPLSPPFGKGGKGDCRSEF